MQKQKDTKSKIFLVYIIIDRFEIAHINISDEENMVFDDQADKCSKLVYFEKFSNKSKAVNKKKYLSSLPDDERLKLVKKENPEMLNLILSINDN